MHHTGSARKDGGNCASSLSRQLEVQSQDACTVAAIHPRPHPDAKVQRTQCTTQLSTSHRWNTHRTCCAGRGQERMAATVPRPPATNSDVEKEEGLHGCRNLSLPTHAPIPTLVSNYRPWKYTQLWLWGRKCISLYIYITLYVYIYIYKCVHM